MIGRRYCAVIGRRCCAAIVRQCSRQLILTQPAPQGFEKRQAGKERVDSSEQIQALQPQQPLLPHCQRLQLCGPLSWGDSQVGFRVSQPTPTRRQYHSIRQHHSVRTSFLNYSQDPFTPTPEMVTPPLSPLLLTLLVLSTNQRLTYPMHACCLLYMYVVIGLEAKKLRKQ